MAGFFILFLSFILYSLASYTGAGLFAGFAYVFSVLLAFVGFGVVINDAENGGRGRW